MYIFKKYNINLVLKIITLAIILMFALNLKAKTVLKVWAFTNELKENGTIAKYEELYPDVQVKFSIFPLENYLAKLKPVFRNPKNAPDIFFAEASTVKELINTKYFMPLTEQKDIMDAKDDYVPYAWNLGMDSKGVLRALTWQATPGGFFYRRSYAKKYLGSDDPKVIAEAISTWDKFLETARKINKASGGKVKMIGGGMDLFNIFSASKKDSYSKDGKFYIDPKLIEWLEFYKTMYQENLTVKTPMFKPAWMNGMKEGVFGYFLPTWGLHYVLKSNAPKTSGDWYLTKPTTSFFWGGTWLGVYYKSKHKKEALDFVKLQTFDKDYMLDWAQRTGDFVSRKSIQAKMDNVKEPFLNNQNHYQFFKNEAPKIKANAMYKYDNAINGFLESEGLQYANGSQTLEKTLDNIRQKVSHAFHLE